MKEVRSEMPMRPDMVWDLVIRLLGIALFVLLVVAYATGEEYPHTHMMIGYAAAALVAAGILWAVIKPRHPPFTPAVHSPMSIKALFQGADRVPQAVASGFLILTALPLCALALTLLTHTWWGTTMIDEMHEVIAYFAVALVGFYVVLVGIASSGPVEDRLRRMFGGHKDPY